MSLNYAIGKSLKNIQDWLIIHGPKSFWRFIPVGKHYILDILRYHGKKDISCLFDVGGNIGQTCIYWSKFFKNASIFSFEPFRKTFEQLRQNTQLKDNIHIHQFAFGDKSNSMEIFLQDNSELNSLLDTSKEIQNQTKEVIEVKTINDFCLEQKISHIDLLKIDVEGFELQVLKGALPLLTGNQINFIYAEVGFVKTDVHKTHFALLDQYLTENGFVLCGYYENFRWGKAKMRLGFSNALYMSKSFAT